MRQTVLLSAMALLVAQPLTAAEPGPLTPGKPAGVKPAQVNNLLPIYGGVALLGTLLAATIFVNGSSVSGTAAIGDAQGAVPTSTSP
jgi:hypothetical protein